MVIILICLILLSKWKYTEMIFLNLIKDIDSFDKFEKYYAKLMTML